MFYEANERPRHAATTVAIRSKPVAPGGRESVSSITPFADSLYQYVADDRSVYPAGQLAGFFAGNPDSPRGRGGRGEDGEGEEEFCPRIYTNRTRMNAELIFRILYY